MNALKDTIWWHLYPLGFLGAAPIAGQQQDAPRRPLSTLEPWLDYAAELGCTGIALGPIFASETHGYDTVDHFRIDPRLGDDEDFDLLAAAAKKRGLRLLLDGVFNHVGRGFEPFERAVREGPDSEAAGWFHLRWKRGADAPPRAGVFEGHDALVTLNHHEPAVADYVERVMNHWLARGAAGWRLDAAYAVPPSFWKQVLPRVRARFPDAYFVGEVIHGDYVRMVADSTLDSLTQYELWKAIWSALNDQNFFELSAALERHEGFLQHMTPMTFLGNHDVTRIASQLQDERCLPHALAVLMTVGGSPSIYAGDEQAFRGVKEHRAGGDDAVRPEFPPSPSGLAPYGQSMHALHQELISLRRQRPWLCDGRTEVLSLTNTALVYRTSARADPRQSIDVALNIGAKRLKLPHASFELLAGGLHNARNIVPHHGWAIGHIGQ
ncbi:Neopullulanase [Pirellulimonas nuda]|uniref:Neopullulanase n=1 Tax=Pirellulimonas nuda TaxID=2528009 RepID=A0A518DCP6_9BACT|nr:alpha-amylase family protein [Pirellulimonas nuda]QDU89233.1 Neopullulanase [Pirellulimonas nuda]